jgi:hypothetical protein
MEKIDQRDFVASEILGLAQNSLISGQFLPQGVLEDFDSRQVRGEAVILFVGKLPGETARGYLEIKCLDILGLVILGECLDIVSTRNERGAGLLGDIASDRAGLEENESIIVLMASSVSQYVVHEKNTRTM